MGRAKRLLKVDETKLDVYLQYYANELELEQMTAVQIEMLERYRKAWALVCLGRTQVMILGQLMKDYQIEERQARYILEESKMIHGQLDKVDKDGRRMASIAYYDLLANLAHQDKDYEAAANIREKADKLAKLHETEEQGWNPDDFKKPAKFIFVNNVNILKQSQSELDI